MESLAKQLIKFPMPLFLFNIVGFKKMSNFIKFYHHTFLLDVFKEYTTLNNFKTGLLDNTNDFDAIHYFLKWTKIVCWW